jgi:EAL domain-containing protein (putative c-di-GMP-specific phosphodiesterase class I)
MRTSGLPNIVIMAVLSCIAIGCGIFVLLSTTQQGLAVVAGLVALALGQFFLAITNWANSSALHDEINGQSNERYIADAKYAETFVEADLFEKEIADLKRRAARYEKDVQDAKLAARDRFQELSHSYERASANSASPLDRTAPGQPQSQEHLSFMLQPVIDLTTNDTAHYRARFSMTAANGSEIDFEKLVVNADRGGLRASLDVHVTNQAIPLLRRLRNKTPGMKMFLPIGAATLMSDDSLAKIAASLAGASDVASGIVFEFNHEALGRLTETGIAGFAKIARAGSTLALADASVAGLDLASLRQLGVKFIGINANSVYSGYGIASTWHEFAQVARGLQFQIMITDIQNATQAAASAQIARLVTGTYFAPARRVKFNAGIASKADLSAAAA